MKEEFYTDLENFKAAVDKYHDWAKIRDVGTMTWVEGARDLWLEVTKARLEMDEWFL